MGNRCELPINVVRTSKAKVLKALNQKVSVGSQHIVDIASVETEH